MRKEVNDWEAKSSTLKSNVTSLLEIFDTAEEWELDPSNAEKASKSNLREIIYEAKKAISAGDPEKLEKLFYDAGNLKTEELRLTLRGTEREAIVYKKVPFFKGYKYQIQLTEDQLMYMEKAAILKYTFKEEKDEYKE
jgi:hypothetical protein